jgi:hypothetical protein
LRKRNGAETIIQHRPTPAKGYSPIFSGIGDIASGLLFQDQSSDPVNWAKRNES